MTPKLLKLGRLFYYFYLPYLILDFDHLGELQFHSRFVGNLGKKRNKNVSNLLQNIWEYQWQKVLHNSSKATFTFFTETKTHPQNLGRLIYKEILQIVLTSLWPEDLEDIFFEKSSKTRFFFLREKKLENFRFQK